jgi:2-polyprenyl-3-methyl-5-hydroxy-6-metoxy-1,4-benzoquinol methylase
MSVFEFGCGTGKILERLKVQKQDIARIGIDISKRNIDFAVYRGRKKFVLYGDENDLHKFVEWDVAYTCSVLDHIPDKKQLRVIINHLKRIANKAVVICETNDVPGKYYFPHNYESFGFKKTNAEIKSKGDNATYNIWVWVNDQKK